MRIWQLSAAMLGILLTCCGGGNKAQPVAGLVGGTAIEHPVLAADFTLTDQHGSPFRMADTRGKVVLMSFIYTHCTDICPFEAVKVKGAHDLLGSDADKVAFVTVTTDPKRDTPAVTAAYSKALGLYDAWYFVGGAAKDVQAVWAAYGIGVTVDPDTDAVAPSTSAPPPKGSQSSGGTADESTGVTNGLSEGDLSLVGDMVQDFGGGYEVGHSAPFWFVDKRGYLRYAMGGDATPAEIVKNIRVLLALR